MNLSKEFIKVPYKNKTESLYDSVFAITKFNYSRTNPEIWSHKAHTEGKKTLHKVAHKGCAERKNEDVVFVFPKGSESIKDKSEIGKKPEYTLVV